MSHAGAKPNATPQEEAWKTGLGLSVTVSAIGLFVWIRHESASSGIVRSTWVWVAVGVLCYLTGVALAAGMMIAIRPASHLFITRKRTHSLGGAIHSICLFGALLVMLTPELRIWPWVAGGAIVIYVAATVRVLRYRIPITKPPDVAVVPGEQERTLTTSSDGKFLWDVFLSYRASTDSNAVRKVAELLIRHGVRPWFAEYEITPDEWENADVIQRKLGEGIAGSRYFLVFTNALWTRSDWCNAEMRSILKVVGQRRDAGLVEALRDVVAEIRLPPTPEPHAKFPDLALLRSFVFVDDVDGLWDFFERQLKWFSGPRRDAELMAVERGLQLTPPSPVSGGYRFPESGLEQRDDVFDPAYRDHQWEFHSFAGNVLGRALKLRVLVNPFRGRLGVLSGIPGVSDDRTLHRQMIASFREHLLSNERMRTLGTHLLLLPDGRSALSVSTVLKGEGTEYNVGRTYCIPLRPDVACRKCGRSLEFYRNVDTQLPEDDIMAACANPECRYAESWPAWEQNAVGEIEFSFAMISWSEEFDLESCRRELVAMSPVMESLTLATTRGWAGKLLEWQAAFVRILVLVVMLEGSRYAEISLAPVWQQRLWAAGIGFAAVEFVLTLLLPSLRRRIMGRSYGHKMWLPLGTWFPRWWNVFKGAMWESIFVALGGFAFVGVATVTTVYAFPKLPLWPVGFLGAATAVLGASVRHIADESQNLTARTSAEVSRA